MLVSCTYLGIITIPPSVTKFLDVSLSVLAKNGHRQSEVFLLSLHCRPCQFPGIHDRYDRDLQSHHNSSRQKNIPQKWEAKLPADEASAAKPLKRTHAKNHAGFCCRQWDGRHTSCYRSPVATRWPQGLTHWISNPENQICCCCKHLSGLMLMCHDFPTFMFRKFFGEDL